jgi:hypothetical protein
MATFSKTVMVASVLALGGCSEGGGGGAGDDETGGASSGQVSMTSMSGGDESPSTSITQGSSPSSTGPDDGSSSDGEGSSTGEPVDPGEYDFDDRPPEDYDQVDRMGMPAVNTAVISSKDAYNAASPADDNDGMFVDEIVGNLTGLHAALDDDLMDALLVPCEVGVCVAQAAPLVVPDTIKIRIGDPAGFPNGRLPSDPVIDVTLAVILLDLSVDGQDATTLVGLNPTANDVDFLEAFPYFAEPHE